LPEMFSWLFLSSKEFCIDPIDRTCFLTTYWLDMICEGAWCPPSYSSSSCSWGCWGRGYSLLFFWLDWMLDFFLKLSCWRTLGAGVLSGL
jgi:hypothetical protein